MAGNVYGHGQARHMGGHLLNGKAQTGGLAAKALQMCIRDRRALEAAFPELSGIMVGRGLIADPA